MSNLDKIMKQLQEKQGEFFTDEVVKELSEAFDNELNERTLVITEKADKYKAELEEELKLETEKVSNDFEEKFNTLKESISTFTDKISSEIVEDNKVDYQNVALVSEAVEVHKRNAKLLENYQIKVNSSESDVEVQTENAKLKEDYNKLYKLSESTHNELNSMKKSKVLAEETEGLSSLQKEKVEELVESLKYEDFDQLREKVKGFKEFITTKDEVKTVVTEDVESINNNKDEEEVVIAEDEESVVKNSRSNFLNKYKNK